MLASELMLNAPDAFYRTITYGVRGDTAYIVVNRPDVMNTLSAATVTDLTSAFARAQNDTNVRGVILTGAGDRAFIAGADITEVSRATQLEAERSAKAGQSLTLQIENLGKPVVAAINGLALGGGLEAAMACTVRVASKHAKFGQPEVKLGLIPGFGGSQRLPRLVGQGRALHLIVTGDTISADEALNFGLVSQVVELSDLMSCAEQLLERIYANGPVATRLAIEAVNRGTDAPLVEGLALERGLFALCAASDDKKEGTSAFLEKRQPVFKGT
jgi:enoyl-CoA hydratase/carnithine racemase